MRYDILYQYVFKLCLVNFVKTTNSKPKTVEISKIQNDSFLDR